MSHLADACSTGTPFDAIAPSYRRVWTDTPQGKSQRAQVWRYVDQLFHSGDWVLDLGCGTGDDAVHLTGLGIRVTCIDQAQAMVEIARSRGLDARRIPFEQLSVLESTHSGAISNFGAFNCAADLSAIAADLARVIQPGGALAVCLMGRFAPLETLKFLLKFDLSRATRRWSGHTHWRGMDIFYYSAREMRDAFAAGFIFERRISIAWGDHQLYIFRRRLA